MQVLQTPLFEKQKKKLRKKQIKELDKAIKVIIKNPKAGEQKKGNLNSIWVYKFKITNQLYLLAYEWNEKTRIIISLGVHENFYRNLKKYLK
ncbi:MAG: type II toxin-antitoxin system RelE/ParE family toxin [Candidatus Brocadiaceae bacterium]|nr:type II toxin-antitoxin system RelE/ParE family toxin [Candidatus Brocadiaceae bacterium]